jgi:hypothetical protein
MKFSVEMVTLGVMIYIPGYMANSSGIQVLLEHYLNSLTGCSIDITK